MWARELRATTESGSQQLSTSGGSDNRRLRYYPTNTPPVKSVSSSNENAGSAKPARSVRPV